MKVFHDLNQPGLAPECALTIGNFDGVHRGHQAILAKLNNEARRRGVPSCVLTFEPHPRDYFSMRAGRQSDMVSRICSLDEKLTEFRRCGVDQVIVLRFDERIAGLSSQAFIEEVLVNGLGVRYVLVGNDFCFGAGRSGSYSTLEAAGQVHGFDTSRMQAYEIRGVRVSSTLIRQALARGDIADVETFLGRPYVMGPQKTQSKRIKPRISTATGMMRSCLNRQKLT
jgi:riboflavin kinase/FMN adenylyltransferase